jgi:hypothetical protein
LVSGQTNHLDGRKPLGRIWGGISQRRQLAHGHQNLDIRPLPDLTRHLPASCSVIEEIVEGFVEGFLGRGNDAVQPREAKSRESQSGTGCAIPR